MLKRYHDHALAQARLMLLSAKDLAATGPSGGVQDVFTRVHAQVVEIRTDHRAEDASPAKGKGREEPARLTFYLDGAHTEESMATCATWFADTVGSAGSAAAQPEGTSDSSPLEIQRVILFNCMQVRSSLAAGLLQCSQCVASVPAHDHAKWPSVRQHSAL